jgi:hypothetical protein
VIGNVCAGSSSQSMVASGAQSVGTDATSKLTQAVSKIAHVQRLLSKNATRLMPIG